MSVKTIKTTNATPSHIRISELHCCNYKHVKCLKDMPDWCLKAGDEYRLHFNGTSPYLHISLGFLQPDQADLGSMSQEELNNLVLTQ